MDGGLTSAVVGDLLLVCIGIAVVLFGSERLIGAARRLAAGLGVSELAIGLTVTSVGTSLPELATTLSASVQAHGEPGTAAGVAAGNIVGSNLFLLGALLGATALAAPLPMRLGALRRDGLVLSLATVGVLLAAGNGRVGRGEGMVLSLGFVAYLLSLARAERAESAAQRAAIPDDVPSAGMWRDVGEVIAGLILVAGGAYLAVHHGVALAERLSIPGPVIGAWVGIGTSLPELVVSLQAARRGATDIGFGNIIGSAIANLLLCLGLSALFAPLAVEPSMLDAGFLVVVTAIALLLSSEHRELSREEGAALVLLFLLYIALRTAG